MKTMLSLLVASSLLYGCAGYTPQQQAQIAAITSRAAVIPECAGEQECKDYWERAIYFVSNYAGRKIQTQTESLIQTYNPPAHGVEIAMSVNRAPLGGGAYRIIAKAWCNNFIGCSDDPKVMLGLFNEFVETGRLAGEKVL